MLKGWTRSCTMKSDFRQTYFVVVTLVLALVAVGAHPVFELTS